MSGDPVTRVTTRTDVAVMPPKESTMLRHHAPQGNYARLLIRAWVEPSTPAALRGAAVPGRGEEGGIVCYVLHELLGWPHVRCYIDAWDQYGALSVVPVKADARRCS
jgi:3-mercaptopyruvate sulfurtransferase SseA